MASPMESTTSTVPATVELPQSIQLNRHVSFVQLFQEALTRKDEMLQREHIPIFASKDDLILHPRSRFLKVWTIWMALMVAITMVAIPFEVAFVGPTINALFVLNRVLDAFFLADIVIQFYCAYYDSSTGLLITSPASVKKHYARTTFTTDLLGMLPYDVLAITLADKYHAIQYFRLLRGFKLVRFFRLIGLTANFEMDYNLNYNQLTLVTLLLGLFYVTHVVGCGLKLIAVLENGDENWLTAIGFEGATVSAQYIASVTYAASVVSNIGYGGIDPVTPAEMLYDTLVLLASAVLYGLGIAAAINVTVNMQKEANAHTQTMNELNKFLEVNKLPQPLRVRVRQYFMQLHRYRILTRTQEQQLMRRMSPELRGVCARAMGENWLTDVPFLRSLSNPLIAEVFVMLRMQTFIPRERIFSATDPADRMFIIRRGSVFVRRRLLTPNKCFGEEMILQKITKRGYDAQALQFVETYVLLRKELFELLEDKPEILKQIRKDVIKMTFSRCAAEAVRRLAEEHAATQEEQDELEDRIQLKHRPPVA